MRLLLLFSFLLAACTWPPARPLPDVGPATAAAVDYLRSEYDAEIGLLRESPITAPDRYWLATDNQLAMYALKEDDRVMVSNLEEAFARYKPRRNGLVEALVGEPISWPPRTETQRQIDGLVWHEHRQFGPRYQDWQEYADLLLYGALNAHNRGKKREAKLLYKRALSLFNGVGFADKPYLAEEGHGLYATYKLALALYVGAQLKEPPNSDLLMALLAKQDDESGGFVTLYNDDGVPQGDTNTETTSYAVLALSALRE